MIYLSWKHVQWKMTKMPEYLIQGPLITYVLFFKEVVPVKQELVAGEMTLKVGRGELGYGSGRHKSSPKKDRFYWIMCTQFLRFKALFFLYLLCLKKATQFPFLLIQSELQGLDLCSAKMENNFYVLRPVEGKAIFNHEMFQTAETQPAFLKVPIFGI